MLSSSKFTFKSPGEPELFMKKKKIVQRIGCAHSVIDSHFRINAHTRRTTRILIKWVLYVVRSTEQPNLWKILEKRFQILFIILFFCSFSCLRRRWWRRRRRRRRRIDGETKKYMNTSESAIWYARQSGKRKLATRASTHVREPRLRKVFCVFSTIFFLPFWIFCTFSLFPSELFTSKLTTPLVWFLDSTDVFLYQSFRSSALFFSFSSLLLVSPYFLALSTVLDDCCLIFNGFQICGR